MSWPMSQDFNEAMQNPRISFTDPDIKTGEAVVGATGLPLPRSGNFADVYQVRGADGREWAVKCFTRPVTGLGDRYAAISEALAAANFPFSVGFEFQSEGIRVGGAGRPIVKMEWVEGLLFNQVVRENAGKPNVLVALGQMWAKLCKRLRDAGVAHADLQHGNVLLVPGSRPGAYGLKLIDYDGMYVPALANNPSGESGHPAYQHPARAKNQAYSPDVDRFPHLVVATALRGLAVGGPALWEKYDNGDNLLFTEDDFKNPAGSKAMQELWKTNDPAVQSLVGRLAIACTKAIPQTPWLDQLVTDADPTPLDDELRRDAMAALGIAAPVPVTPVPPPSEEVEAEVELVEVESPKHAKQSNETHFSDAADEPRYSRKPRKQEKASNNTMFIAIGAVVLLGGVAAAVVMSRGKPQPEVAQVTKPAETKAPETKPPAVTKETPKKEREPKEPKGVPIPPVKQKDPVSVSVAGFELLDEPYPKSDVSPTIGGWRKRGTEFLLVISNSSDKSALISETKGLQLAAHRVAVHPAPKEPVAVVWKSPIAGKVRTTSKVTHLDRMGGNGVEWRLEHRSGDRSNILADGSLEIGGEGQSAPKVLQVEKGDTIVVVVDAKAGDHFHDMTEVALTITDADKPGVVWDLGTDVANNISDGNPHADKQGNKDTWSFAFSGASVMPKTTGPEPMALKPRWTVPIDTQGAAAKLHVQMEFDTILMGSERSSLLSVELTSGTKRPAFLWYGLSGGNGFSSMDGGRVAKCLTDEVEVLTWDVKTTKPIERYPLPRLADGAGKATHRLMHLSPNGDYLVLARTALGNGEPAEVPFQITDTKTRKPLLETTWTGGTTHFTADSGRVLVAETRGRFRWFKLPSGEPDGGWEYSAPEEGMFHTVTDVSGDGRVIGYVGPGKKGTGKAGISVIDGKTGEELQRFGAAYRDDVGMRFSADGRFAALLRQPSGDEACVDVVSTAKFEVVAKAKFAGNQSTPTFALSGGGELLLAHDPKSGNLHRFELPAAGPP